MPAEPVVVEEPESISQAAIGEVVEVVVGASGVDDPADPARAVTDEDVSTLVDAQGTPRSEDAAGPPQSAG